ncbi:hypothetical protein SDC9_04137 [bioreactor metagenome]|uniref:Phage tail assembly protein n=1 Tax=bioreactor metagenome TaxID=1076179 RepID=A0A644SVG2_9ZZZZ|nr:phage tail assembly protein [Negativicutes bacterium]
MKITFDKPFEFEGKTFEGLDLNLDALTGRHLIDAATEARALGDKSPVMELSKTYQAVLAAKASKMSADMIIALPGKEFSRVTLQVANFLFE